MSLSNLLGLSLEAVAPDRSAIARLLSAAERNIADSQLAGLSIENQFDADLGWWRRCGGDYAHAQKRAQCAMGNRFLETKAVFDVDTLRRIDADHFCCKLLASRH